MPAAGFRSLPAVKASHMHVCTSYPFQPCTCLLLHVKQPFTPQAQSVEAPPFLKGGAFRRFDQSDTQASRQRY